MKNNKGWLSDSTREKIKQALNEKISLGLMPVKNKFPKPISASKENKLMKGVNYEMDCH